ncbi:MAG: LemA family protein [Chitinophagaceae bacterium]|nr:LemA family protein [Chitinophagaceae bacterium]
MPVLIIVGILVLIVIWVVGLYNGLVRLRNRRQNAFADIDVQLRQRHDLVPQLVETVKGYASHEKELLLKVTEARTAAMAATTIDGKIAAEQQLTSALQGLKVQVEAYPDLKANQNFLQLQEELSDIENKLAASRRFFNGATTEYNNAVESFPGNMIARNFGFKREVMFDLGEDTRKQMDEPPKIQF